MPGNSKCRIGIKRAGDMEDQPKISVILPVYNGERYVGSSIESVIGQTLKNWELIIVNDGSADRSKQIIDGYAKTDKRIRVIDNGVNCGLPRSLNKGFAIAEGEYLTWTSDDNIYHKTAFEVLAGELDHRKRAGMVYAGMNVIDDKGIVVGKRTGDDGNLYKSNCVGACFMYRNECLKTIGLYDENRIYVEDYDYWLRIAGKYELVRIDEILYDYRYHGNSLTIKKYKQVGAMLSRLRQDHIDEIIKNINGDELRALVAEMIICGNDEIFKYLDDETVEDLKFISNRHKELRSRKAWIFGAGSLGQNVLEIISDLEIEGYIDNDISKTGGELLGKKIIGLNTYVEKYRDAGIVVATDLKYAYSILNQLNAAGIDDAVLLYDLC